MRRIPRLRQPSAVFSQCLQSPVAVPQQKAAVPRTAAAASCLGRPRDFSTTSNRTFHRPRALAAKAKAGLGKASTRGKEARTAKASRPEDDLFASSTEGEEDPFAALTNTAAAPTTPQIIHTDLVLPPTDTTVAPRPDDLDQGEEEYTPADSAHDLDIVGGLQGWFSKKKKHWAPSKDFVGFAPSQRVTKPALVELHTMRAVLEGVAVATYVKGMLDKGWMAEAWWDGGRKGVNQVLGLAFKVDENGQVTLRKGYEAIVQMLNVNASPKAAVKEDTVTAQEADEMLRTRDQSWKQISLEDPELKFAVAKRIYQLTGHAIPDAKLMHIKTAAQLLETIAKPPAPRKVIDAIHQRGELTKLPNVEVFATRRTPVHAAKKVGSWKVIEKELEKRGLPVLGKDKIDGFREREWFRGPMPAKKDRKKRRP